MSPHHATYRQIERVARGIRKRTLRFTLDNGGGYLAQACSGAEIIASLYCEIMQLGPSLGALEPARLPAPGEPALPSGGLYNGAPASGYDRFFLSCCHYAVALYAALVEVGRLSETALDVAGQDAWNMDLIASEFTPGCETNSGSLGQTISIAAGCAHAYRLQGKSGRIFCMLSDGELDEGQDWECFQTSAQLGLDNLIIYIDVNHMQAEGWTRDIVGIEPLEERFSSFGWAAVRVDGHDPAALISAANTPHDGRPLAVICDTDPARGIAPMSDVVPCHYVRVPADVRAEFECAYEEM